MIHSGAVIAAGVSQGRSTTLGLDFRVMSANMPHPFYTVFHKVILSSRPAISVSLLLLSLILRSRWMTSDDLIVFNFAEVSGYITGVKQDCGVQ